MNLVIKLKASTTLAEAEEYIEQLTDDEDFMDICEEIALKPEGVP